MADAKVFLVHGWDGSPANNWFPWLKRELEQRGFLVSAPAMPHPQIPTIEDWVSHLSATVGKPDENTYLIGHSMGCQAIARYLERLPARATVGGAVFVAGFLKRLTNIGDSPEEKAVEREWLQTPLDLKKVKNHLSQSVAIFSDDDPWVPLDNQNDFKDELGSSIIIEHAKRHFSNEAGIKELPAALDAVLTMTRDRSQD